MTAIARPFRPSALIEPRSIAAGVLAAAALLGVYLGIISLAQGVEHALEPREDRNQAIWLEHDGRTYHFCDPACVDTFRDEPGRWMQDAPVAIAD